MIVFLYILCFFSEHFSLLTPPFVYLSPHRPPPSLSTPSISSMSGHRHLRTRLNSCSDVDGDNDNTNEKFPPKTQLSPPPPLAGRKRGAMEGKPNVVAESSDHDVHIRTERERRKKMRNMFSNLHALLPHLPPKVDKSSIVDEAINYIKALQQTLQKLHNQKHEKLQNNVNNNHNNTPAPSSKDDMSTTREAFLADNDMSSNDVPPAPPPCTTVFQIWSSSNVVLSVCGGDAHFSVCSGKKAGLFAAVCYVMEKYEIEVVSAHVSSDLHRTFFMIQAHVNGVCDEFGVAIAAEETFKQAAGEIIFWLSS